MYRSPGFAPRGTGRAMPDVVRRYISVEEYLDPTVEGTPVSAPMKTFKDAVRVRFLLREGEPRFYYNITHTTKCAVISREEPT